MAATYQDICQEEQPWVALGNFMNDWFDAPLAHKPEVRTYLIERTPEPFTRRNIYCGNRMFANTYELAEQYRHFSPPLRSTS
ncbi:MAG TPA: hypothetical protein DCS90_13900 [Ktedonobacter sp.]|nr:hypothetical protein [Ktedonobacter sp.]